MTKEQAQAEYQTKVANAVRTVKKLNDAVFEVPSQSESQPHILTVTDSNVTYCSCKGWKYCGHCYHALAVEKSLEETQEVVQVAQAYIRIASGGTVRENNQARTRQHGEFSLMR